MEPLVIKDSHTSTLKSSEIVLSTAVSSFRDFSNPSVDDHGVITQSNEINNSNGAQVYSMHSNGSPVASQCVNHVPRTISPHRPHISTITDLLSADNQSQTSCENSNQTVRFPSPYQSTDQNNNLCVPIPYSSALKINLSQMNYQKAMNNDEKDSNALMCIDNSLKSLISVPIQQLPVPIPLKKPSLSRSSNAAPSHKCPTCGKNYRTISTLNTHMRKHASSNMQHKRYVCNQCNYSSEYQRNVLKHFEQSHNSSDFADQVWLKDTGSRKQSVSDSNMEHTISSNFIPPGDSRAGVDNMRKVYAPYNHSMMNHGAYGECFSLLVSFLKISLVFRDLIHQWNKCRSLIQKGLEVVYKIDLLLLVCTMIIFFIVL